MAKWLIRRSERNRGPKWHCVDFVGSRGQESRGIADFIAIRKDHRFPAKRGFRQGDLFEIVIVQSKGGSAPRPTREDIERLLRLERYYHAKAVVLSEWKRGQQPSFSALTASGLWKPVSPSDIFD